MWNGTNRIERAARLLVSSAPSSTAGRRAWPPSAVTCHHRSPSIVIYRHPQPYREESVATVTTLGASLQLTQHDDTLPVHNSRQRSAFPPNYVRTAMRPACDDCTWCHAMSWKVNASARPSRPKPGSATCCHAMQCNAMRRSAMERSALPPSSATATARASPRLARLADRILAR